MYNERRGKRHSAVNPCAAMAQAVERILGKDEVTSSILVSSSKNKALYLNGYGAFSFSFCAGLMRKTLKNTPNNATLPLV